MANAILLKGGGGGIGSSDVTASKAQILSTKTALATDSNDEAALGTMPNNGTINQTLSINGSYSIPAGYTDGGTINTQSITVEETIMVYPTNQNQTIETTGKYFTGGIIIPGAANLVASNIKKGVTILGITGTWEGYV